MLYAITATRGNWFQTHQPEHESDNCAGNTVTSVCVTKKEDYFSGKFDQHLSLYRGSVNQRYRRDRDFGSYESLVRYDFLKFSTIVAQFLQ